MHKGACVDKRPGADGMDRKGDETRSTLVTAGRRSRSGNQQVDPKEKMRYKDRRGLIAGDEKSTNNKERKKLSDITCFKCNDIWQGITREDS